MQRYKLFEREGEREGKFSLNQEVTRLVRTNTKNQANDGYSESEKMAKRKDGQNEKKTKQNEMEREERERELENPAYSKN